MARYFLRLMTLFISLTQNLPSATFLRMPISSVMSLFCIIHGFALDLTQSSPLGYSLPTVKMRLYKSRTRGCIFSTAGVSLLPASAQIASPTSGVAAEVVLVQVSIAICKDTKGDHNSFHPTFTFPFSPFSIKRTKGKKERKKKKSWKKSFFHHHSIHDG